MARRLAIGLAALQLAAAAHADVGITLEVLGYSDVHEECEIKMSFATPETYGDIQFAYTIEIEGKGSLECELTTYAGGAQDVSCYSPKPFDYTCEDPMVVRATGLDCKDREGNEIDCGGASLTAPRAGLFVFE